MRGYWVLATALPLRTYFAGFTEIGWRATPRMGEAKTFNTRREATQSPAYYHPMSLFEPVQIKERSR